MAILHWRLQPYALEAVTICIGCCNRMHWRLQPYALEAATVCEGTRNVACAMSASECKTRAPQDMIMMSLFLLPKEELG